MYVSLPFPLSRAEVATSDLGFWLVEDRETWHPKAWVWTSLCYLLAMSPWLILSSVCLGVKCVCWETVLHRVLVFLCILHAEVPTAFALVCLFKDVWIVRSPGRYMPWKSNLGSISLGVLRCSGVHGVRPLCHVLQELLLRGTGANAGTVASALDLSKTPVCPWPRRSMSPVCIWETGRLRH